MNLLTTLCLASALALAAFAAVPQSETHKDETTHSKEINAMKLGNFSVSLAVKDLKKSKAFYEKIDFKEVGGKLELNYLIMQNGTTTIGLFQGMFEENILTFNPGWNKDKETLKQFDDVRAIQSRLKERGLKLALEADADTDGPAHFVLQDPDGNQIMFDQHVPKPKH
jgi:lactoylglutathione lyase